MDFQLQKISSRFNGDQTVKFKKILVEIYNELYSYNEFHDFSRRVTYDFEKNVCTFKNRKSRIVQDWDSWVGKILYPKVCPNKEVDIESFGIKDNYVDLEFIIKTIYSNNVELEEDLAEIIIENNLHCYSMLYEIANNYYTKRIVKEISQYNLRISGINWNKLFEICNISTLSLLVSTTSVMAVGMYLISIYLMSNQWLSYILQIGGFLTIAFSNILFVKFLIRRKLFSIKPYINEIHKR